MNPEHDVVAVKRNGVAVHREELVAYTDDDVACQPTTIDTVTVGDHDMGPLTVLKL
jgi:hypothetical protein